MARGVEYAKFFKVLEEEEQQPIDNIELIKDDAGKDLAQGETNILDILEEEEQGNLTYEQVPRDMEASPTRVE